MAAVRAVQNSPKVLDVINSFYPKELWIGRPKLKNNVDVFNNLCINDLWLSVQNPAHFRYCLSHRGENHDAGREITFLVRGDCQNRGDSGRREPNSLLHRRLDTSKFARSFGRRHATLAVTH